jgi:hypothetical protein
MTHTVEMSDVSLIMFYVFLTLLVYCYGKYHEYLIIVGIEQEARGEYSPPNRHRYNLRNRKNL